MHNTIILSIIQIANNWIQPDKNTMGLFEKEKQLSFLNVFLVHFLARFLSPFYSDFHIYVSLCTHGRISHINYEIRTLVHFLGQDFEYIHKCYHILSNKKFVIYGPNHLTVIYHAAE